MMLWARRIALILAGAVLMTLLTIPASSRRLLLSLVWHPAPPPRPLPAPAPTPPPVAPRGVHQKRPVYLHDLQEAEDRALVLLNRFRAANGRQPLTEQRRLRLVARNYSRRMLEEGFFDHIDPDGKTPRDRIPGGMRDYWFLTENIETNSGFPDPVAKTAEDWEASPAHRKNLLDERPNVTGVGAWSDGEAWYFTQVFAGVRP